MRLQLRRLCVPIVGLATLVTMVSAGMAHAAPVATSAGTGSVRPQLTTNTNAPCNTEPKKMGRAQCFAVVRTPADHQIAPLAAEPPSTALGPADIQDAYNLPAGAGVGQTVAIVDAGDDAHAESDLAVFREQYGLPPCTTDNGCFTKVNQRGEQGNYPPDAGWGIEISLDVDAVSAACPACNILLVEADTGSLDNMGAAVELAVALGAKYVSNSWGLGGNEDPSETDYDHYFDHKGVAITFSSGDSPHPNWPASNPHVTAAGGTKLTRDASTDRGWTETPWTKGGSGCSAYEPRPDYQLGMDDLDTLCPDNRATADVSADADPASGLAVYDSHDGYDWVQVGGTSLSSPLIAAMYALAGTPVAGTYPVTYPYDPAAHSHLFDITTGSNGDCGNLLCQAGTGWDGPTGWGTPNGVSAFTTGPHGDIAGTVTDADSGDPIARATVSTPEGYQTNTDEDGQYDLNVPVGSYDVTASTFGYASKTQTGVQVTDGQTVTVNFALPTVSSSILSGTVTDGSGHGWPLYAKITIDGDPRGPTYTNPYTGHYSVDLPQQNTYALHVTPVYLPGYQTKDLTVQIGTADVQRDMAVAVIDQAVCTAPGYAAAYHPLGTDFEGWTDTTPQDGWTNVDNIDSGVHTPWNFTAHAFINNALPGGGDIYNLTGGSGVFAIASGVLDPPGGDQYADTDLISPVVDLSGQTSPEIGFDTDYKSRGAGDRVSVADVDLSLDGGQTWSTVWKNITDDVQGHVDIPIPQAAGQANVRVKFHYTTWAEWYWELDNVFIGSPPTCAPSIQGGLVAGVVTDANTGDGLNNATVTRQDDSGESTVTASNPGDPNLPDGFYWLFNPGTGATDFTVTKLKYATAAASVNVAADAVTRQDFALQAGHLAITPGGIAVTENMGGPSVNKTVTVTNDGTGPAHVTLGEQNGGFTSMSVQPSTKARGAPLQRVSGHFTPDAMVPPVHHPKPTPEDRSATPSAPPWTAIADYPISIADNAVAYHDGKLYSVAGYSGGPVATGYVYDASTEAWSRIADTPQPLEAPVGAFVAGKMYLVGGWDQFYRSSASVYAYDPGTDTWSQVADLPRSGVAAAGAAVLDGQLYIVGGCAQASPCTPTASTFRYDPRTDTWHQLADYPEPVAWQACGGIAGQVVCAGGTGSTDATYVYDPATDTWSRGADMPYGDFGMASGSANGRLQIVGGVTGSSTVTNQAVEYDPASDTWSALPNANTAEYRVGGACGFYQVGTHAEVLPGYDQCADGVSWLAEDATELDLTPGQSVQVTVTVDASAIGQPGDYAAELSIATDTPYHFSPITVNLRVDPPVTWAKVAGQVTDADSGDPIGGATVQFCSNYRPHRGGCGSTSFTVKTDHNGHYQLWLDIRYSPLRAIAARDSYIQQIKTVRLRPGKTTTRNFALHGFG